MPAKLQPRHLAVALHKVLPRSKLDLGEVVVSMTPALVQCVNTEALPLSGSALVLSLDTFSLLATESMRAWSVIDHLPLEPDLDFQGSQGVGGVSDLLTELLRKQGYKPSGPHNLQRLLERWQEAGFVEYEVTAANERR